MEALPGKSFMGKDLFVGRAQKKTERQALLKQKLDDVRQERIAKYQVRGGVPGGWLWKQGRRVQGLAVDLNTR